ncbi:MAG: zinc-dependent metalloprotease [Bacteroidales bacterium]|nr:zinc-dependent metalloprotease [Bacteroidales bacterium]
MRKIGFLVIMLAIITTQAQTQGLVLQNKQNQQTTTDFSIGCGSYDFMKHIDSKQPGYLDLSNQSMLDIENSISTQNKTKSADSIYVIPVVFHIVYNNSSENIPDSVIHNQIEILNNSYRRTNSDTINTRTLFQNIVGDAKIEFKLAETDPAGNPTTGITRTNSDIEYFGGILPYSSGQNQEITDWVNDSLFYNFFRITQDTLGGINAWDTEKYLNVWIGDLRILEPNFDNFEELVFFGLATPPIDHHNWPDSVLGAVNIYEQGVILHYVNIGANNPNSFAAPYNVYNGLVTTGKMLVHEVGHFLGLRHIWGDGDCNSDDFVYDTPRSNAASQYNCNKTRNTCFDDIYGMDLPDMVENYMDYSSGNCQNSFTYGQAAVMQYVLYYYRPNLPNIKVISNVEDNIFYQNIQIYPNPTNGTITLKFKSEIDNIQINIRDITGKLIKNICSTHNNTIIFEIEGSKGIYFMEILSNNSAATYKIVKL